jgi:DNA-binding MarR family transcriptional regulator
MSFQGYPDMSGSEPRLGDLPDMVGVELRIAQILADKVYASVQQPGMASGHYTVLSLIDSNPGINQSTLARCMYLDRSSMVPILDQFENKGWIGRTRMAHDRRAHAIQLTRAGRTALKQADRKVRDLEKRIAEQMGSKKSEQLLSLIKQLQTALLALQDG